MLGGGKAALEAHRRELLEELLKVDRALYALEYGDEFEKKPAKAGLGGSETLVSDSQDGKRDDWIVAQPMKRRTAGTPQGSRLKKRRQHGPARRETPPPLDLGRHVLLNGLEMVVLKAVKGGDGVWLYDLHRADTRQVEYMHLKRTSGPGDVHAGDEVLYKLRRRWQIAMVVNIHKQSWPFICDVAIIKRRVEETRLVLTK